MRKPRRAVSLKDHELLLVTQNVPSIHYGPSDYIHLEARNEAWCEEVMEGSSWVERWMAEVDKKILQLIPYIICSDSDGNILSYRRQGGGETRLEGKRSIGIGGHVNDRDKEIETNDYKQHMEKTKTSNSWDIIINGAARELEEELGLSRLYSSRELKQVGTIFTPTDGVTMTPLPRVGQVHLGIIYTLNISNQITVKASEGLVDPVFLLDIPDLEEYELWSRMILDNIDTIRTISHDNDRRRRPQ